MFLNVLQKLCSYMQNMYHFYLIVKALRCISHKVFFFFDNRLIFECFMKIIKCQCCKICIGILEFLTSSYRRDS